LFVRRNAGRVVGPMLRPWGRHDGQVPEVDDDQLAALRRLPAAFGPIEVVEVVGNDPGDDLAGPQDETIGGARMADPRRMTPEEHGEAHALLVKAVTDPDWQAASQALDELMGKLMVIRRLLEAEERLPRREPWTDPM
jgi:hypothetical protein